VFRLSPNLTLLFSEAGEDPVDRVYAAAAEGFDAVDLWGCDTDRLALRRAFDATGITPLVLTVCPGGSITDPATHNEFLEGVRSTLEAATELGCPYIVATSGMARPVVPAAEQHAAIVDALQRAADIVAGSNVRILLENLNSRVDHPGVYLDTTTETLEIVREIG
jgi:hydroxypyruvate isomerase